MRADSTRPRTAIPPRTAHPRGARLFPYGDTPLVEQVWERVARDTQVRRQHRAALWIGVGRGDAILASEVAADWCPDEYLAWRWWGAASDPIRHLWPTVREHIRAVPGRPTPPAALRFVLVQYRWRTWTEQESIIAMIDDLLDEQLTQQQLRP